MARQLRWAPGGAGPVDAVNVRYGLALSGLWRYEGPSNLFFQATGGRGLGGYVDDLDGQAADLRATSQRFLTQVGYAGLAGSSNTSRPACAAT